MTLPMCLSFDVCVWVWNSSLHNKNFAFYINRLWAPAFICRHLLNKLYCIYLLSKASINIHQLIPDQPPSGPPSSTLTTPPTSHFWPHTAYHSPISWQTLPAIAQQPPRDCSQPVVEQGPSSLPSVTKPHPWPNSWLVRWLTEASC